MSYYLTKSPTALSLCEKYLTFTNPAYVSAKRRGNKKAQYMPHDIRLYKIIGDKIEIPFGTYYYWSSACGKSPYVKKPYITYNGNIPLYDYQIKAVNYLKSTNNALLISGTGSGKTQIGIALIKELGLRTLWITHTKDLLDQSKERFKTYFSNAVGEIAEGKINIQDMTFALIQTLSKIDLSLYKDMFDCIIIDEVQHCGANINNTTMYEKVLARLNASHRYGLTATLHRADGLQRVIEELISHNIYKISEEETKKLKAIYKVIEYDKEPIKTRIAHNYLDKDIYILPYINTDGTVNYANLISYLSSDEARTKFIVDLVKSHPDRTIAILTLRKSHCERFKELIDNSYYLSSNLSRNARKSDLEAFKETKNKVFIATYQLAKEGLDIPNLDMLILATPVKDETILIQSIGRIERYQEGKNTPIVYDIVDTKISYCYNAYLKSRKRVLKRYGYVLK